MPAYNMLVAVRTAHGEQPENLLKRTLSLTSFSKFLSAATLTHIHPSFNHSVLTLYDALGTALITTSEIARHSSSESVHRCEVWCGRYCRAEVGFEKRGRFVYSFEANKRSRKKRKVGGELPG